MLSHVTETPCKATLQETIPSALHVLYIGTHGPTTVITKERIKLSPLLDPDQGPSSPSRTCILLVLATSSLPKSLELQVKASQPERLHVECGFPHCAPEQGWVGLTR